jgi:hypothetical protein
MLNDDRNNLELMHELQSLVIERSPVLGWIYTHNALVDKTSHIKYPNALYPCQLLDLIEQEAHEKAAVFVEATNA